MDLWLMICLINMINDGEWDDVNGNNSGGSSNGGTLVGHILGGYSLT